MSVPVTPVPIGNAVSQLAAGERCHIGSRRAVICAGGGGPMRQHGMGAVGGVLGAAAVGERRGARRAMGGGDLVRAVGNFLG